MFLSLRLLLFRPGVPGCRIAAHRLPFLVACFSRYPLPALATRCSFLRTYGAALFGYTKLYEQVPGEADGVVKVLLNS